MLKDLDDAARWLEEVMPADPPVEELRKFFIEWMEAQVSERGLSRDVIDSYNLVNPLGMSADGLLRYWKKFHV